MPASHVHRSSSAPLLAVLVQPHHHVEVPVLGSLVHRLRSDTPFVRNRYKTTMLTASMAAEGRNKTSTQRERSTGMFSSARGARHTCISSTCRTATYELLFHPLRSHYSVLWSHYSVLSHVQPSVRFSWSHLTTSRCPLAAAKSMALVLNSFACPEVSASICPFWAARSPSLAPSRVHKRPPMNKGKNNHVRQIGENLATNMGDARACRGEGDEREGKRTYGKAMACLPWD